MLTATLLALAAAVLHAGWNLIAKRAIDPFLALWALFLSAGIVSVVVLGVGVFVGAGPSPAGWGWAMATGAVHAPYIVLLGRAYDEGDFSLAYPLARGGGALLAGINGVVLLGDRPSIWSAAAIVVTIGGMGLLAVGAERRQVVIALTVAVTIGTYTTIDSHAARGSGGSLYVFAVFLMAAIGISSSGVAMGRGAALLAVPRSAWFRSALAGTMSIATYGLVLVAVRRAPVGYVAALRESSVLLAALIGWRVLGEGSGRARAAGAAAIVVGLIVLTATSTIR